LTGGPDNDGRLIRELVEQGYPVISPEYRGSSGYGMAYERAMDYGAREDDDVLMARDWMLQRYPFLDAKRVGLVGWSHGGMISLMSRLYPAAWIATWTCGQRQPSGLGWLLHRATQLSVGRRLRGLVSSSNRRQRARRRAESPAHAV